MYIFSEGVPQTWGHQPKKGDSLVPASLFVLDDGPKEVPVAELANSMQSEKNRDSRMIRWKVLWLSLL